jgi:hypothetical protein
MIKGHAVRIARIHQACATMEELHQQTRALYDSITAEARRTRAVAQTLKARKKSITRRR